MPGGGVGVQAPEASPGRYVRHNDEVPPDDDGGCDDVLGVQVRGRYVRHNHEVPPDDDGGCDDVLGVQVRGPGDDPFDILAKRAPVERLLGGVGVQAPEASPGRYVRHYDEVPPDDDDGCDDVRGPGDDPFDIPAKRAPVERLRRWRLPNLILKCWPKRKKQGDEGPTPPV